MEDKPLPDFSGAGDLPWFMTELQGGNNVYSGGEAMCPTPDEIMQWLWIVAGTEGCVLFQSLDGKGTQCRSPFG